MFSVQCSCFVFCRFFRRRAFWLWICREVTFFGVTCSVLLLLSLCSELMLLLVPFAGLFLVALFKSFPWFVALILFYSCFFLSVFQKEELYWLSKKPNGVTLPKLMVSPLSGCHILNWF